MKTMTISAQRSGGHIGPPLHGAALAALLVSCVLVPQALAQRPGSGVDAYGYQLFDQGQPECAYQFVDVAGSGTPVVLTASSAAPARDDGGAVVALNSSFELYGEALTSLVMSSNGYLGASSSLADEDGGDFSNDATLPAIPDNNPAAVARAMAFHEELSGEAPGGTTRFEYFAACPRPSGAVAGEACTVFQWSSWGFLGAPGTFDFQAILYHTSFAITFQVDLGALAHGGATLGIQSSDAGSALQYQPPAALTGSTAVCLFEPRFPPGGLVADLSITKTDKTDSLVGATEVTYEIAVRNAGPSPVTGATVSDPVVAPLENCTWTCAASAGSACTAAGTGSIADAADLLAGGWAVYTLTCDIVPGAMGSVDNTAAVAAPAGVNDPNPANDTAGDTDPVPVALTGFAVE